MDSVKISSIIPVYNGEKYIEECLDSIINQTLTEIEIICVNDGSTDNTLDILNHYSKLDDRIKIITTKNNGQGSARNKALSIAKGKYVSFVDADDWIDSKTYESLYNRAEELDTDMLFFQMINYINSSKKLVKTDLYDYKCFSDNDVNDIFSFNDIKDFLFTVAVCPVSKLYKKDFLIKNNLRFPEGIIYEDNIFFYNAILIARKMGFIDKHFYYRRRHDESVTQNITKKAFDIVDVTNKMLDIFKNHGVYSQYPSDIINHTFSMILEWFFKSPLEYCEDFFSIIKQDSYAFNELCCDFSKFLNNKHKPIFELFLENNHYLDFISVYNLKSASYSKVIESKNQDYKISVVIPVYNNDVVIHRTVMSILNQSLGRNNIEILLIDDHSNESTARVIDTYAEDYDNIKAIHLKENTKSSGTPRNIGIKEASSDYVMFLDHDDFFEINALEILYNEIKNNDCDVVFGTYAIVSENNLNKISYPKEKHGFFESIEDNDRLVSFPPPSIWTKLFKKQLILNNNILFPPIIGEDAIFMAKTLLKAKGISYLWDSLICFHALDNNSATNNVSLKYLVEALTSEKYLFDLFKSIDKEYYFKYRCEGNIDFFLTQFLRSNLNIDEANKIIPMLTIFFKKTQIYSLTPNIERNKKLFDYFIDGDTESIFSFKNEFGKQIIDADSINLNNYLSKVKNKFSIFIRKFKFH